MERNNGLLTAHATLNRHDVAQRSTAASSGGVSPPGPSSSETLGELAGGTPALPGSSWEGTTGAGYEKYDRTHVASAPPASATLILSADPAFRGDASRLNPEQLVIIAASSCQLLSFLAVAARAQVEILEYDDEAEAEMPEDDLPVRITRIRLRPRIVVGPNNSAARIRQLVEIAHNECYIANSLKGQISVEPTIEVRNP